MKKVLKRLLLTLRDLLAPFARFSEVSILCYHSISDSTHETAVTVQEFERHLLFLKKRGYAFVSVRDVVNWMDGVGILPRKAIALTFDDGYADFETAVLPLLRRFTAPAALFYMEHPSEVWDAPLLSPEARERLTLDRLVTLGFHSRTHPNLDGLSGEALVAEVAPPRKECFFAYPGGHYSEEAVEAVKRAGYVAAFSIKPTLVGKKSDRYLMPRAVVTKGVSLWELRFATTKALDWYRALWRAVR